MLFSAYKSNGKYLISLISDIHVGLCVQYIFDIHVLNVNALRIIDVGREGKECRIGSYRSKNEKAGGKKRHGHVE